MTYRRTSGRQCCLGTRFLAAEGNCPYTKSAESKTGVVHIEEHHMYKYGRGLIKPRRSIYKAIGYNLNLAGTSLLRVYIPTLSVYSLSLWISLQRIIWFYTFFVLGVIFSPLSHLLMIHTHNPCLYSHRVTIQQILRSVRSRQAAFIQPRSKFEIF